MPIPAEEDLTGPCVVAYTTESDHQPEVRRAAAAHARGHGCVLLLYAADAASWFSEPTPGAWSADGEQDLYGARLRVHDLTTLGRHEIARQVAEAHGGSVRVGAAPSPPTRSDRTPTSSSRRPHSKRSTS